MKKKARYEAYIVNGQPRVSLRTTQDTNITRCYSITEAAQLASHLNGLLDQLEEERELRR